MTEVRLTEQEIDQAREAFLEFDKDGSGSIDQVCFFHFTHTLCIFFCMILCVEVFFGGSLFLRILHHRT